MNGAARASICTGNNMSPNWYGPVGYPPYFTRNSEEKCPQKYKLSRCEQSAVMKDGSSEFTIDDNDNEACTAGSNCFPTKQNCNDTLACSDLLALKDELLEGGHNIVCRHEKTYWQMNSGESKGCLENAYCLDPKIEATQRQLQPYGYASAKAFASAFRDMKIPIGKEYSSPFSRCAEHADVFSEDVPNEKRLELMYMGGWKEVLAVNNITDISKLNALKWQAHNIRNFAGKKPTDGTNNILVTHGINIKLGFGLAVDEGYCVVLKPVETEPSLAESIGSIIVANRDFVFDSDAFPVDAIARMSPESAVHMQTCHDVQADVLSNTESNYGILSYDTNGDMKITKYEFCSIHDAPNSEDTFDFLLAIQPTALGKLYDSSTEEPYLELGQFLHLNWGWREFATSNGGISYPWRTILENTIGVGGDTAEERVAAFRRANAVSSALVNVLNNSSDKYPSMNVMKASFLQCEALPEFQSDAIAACSAKTFLADSGGEKYFPVGPGDSGASYGKSSLFGTPLAYPSIWIPDFYDSDYLKVATCLVRNGEMSFTDLLESMGCKQESGDGIVLETNRKNSENGEVCSGINNMATISIIVLTSLLGLSISAVIGYHLWMIKQRKNNPNPNPNLSKQEEWDEDKENGAEE